MPLADGVDHRRCHGSHEEGPDERSIERARTEEALGSHHAPENTTVEMDAGDGTVETVGRLWRAQAGYVEEHPVQDANLGYARRERGDHLHLEQQLGGNLHVVAEFQVGGELDALRRADVGICHKHHVRYGAPGEDGAAYKLADEIEAAMLVGNRHDDADGDEEDGSNAQGEHESVPRQMDRVVLDNENPNGQHGDKSGQVPNHRRVFIPAHQAGVDVFGTIHHAFRVSRARASSSRVGGNGLVFCRAFPPMALSQRLSRLFPYISAMPAGGVRDERRKRGKLDSIGQDVRDWQIDSRVGLVRNLVEEKIRGEYLANVIRFPGVIKHCRREDGKVCRKENILVICPLSVRIFQLRNRPTHQRGDDPHHQDQAADNVGSSPPRRQQW